MCSRMLWAYSWGMLTRKSCLVYLQISVDLSVEGCLALSLPRMQTELGRAGLHQALKQTSSGVHLAYRVSPSALGLGHVPDATRLVRV